MSFFRVLLALLISAGIALGLYAAVDGRGLERAVEAVRTEIAARTGTAVEEVAEEDAAARGETMVMERSEPQSATDDGPVSPGEDASGMAEAAPADEETAPVEAAAGTETSTVTESTSFAARVQEDADAAGTEETAIDASGDGTAEQDEQDEQEQDAAETTGEPGENDLPRIATMPAPPETVLPDDAQAPAALETQETLPAALVAEASDAPSSTGTVDAGTPSDETPVDGEDASEMDASDTGVSSTAALDVVNGGMDYVEARETMIEAGWSPRLPATRTGGPNPAENAMIEAGYGELEGCNDADRPICRFEFVDGENRIAAVLTAGSGIDPSVIDAFLMTIRAE